LGVRNTKLTDEKEQNYINVYKELREAAPEILENINKDPQNADIGLAQYKKIENIIIGGGFTNYEDFIYTNAKIGSIFSIMQAEKSMTTFENKNESGNEMFEDAIRQFEELINDPDTPEDMKAEYKKSIEEIREAQNEMNDEYGNNLKWANAVLSAQKISGLVVDEEDIRIVAKYEQEIMATYVGFQLPELPDGKFPKIDFTSYE